MPLPISADEPDWSRERKRLFEWQPAKSLLASLRAYQKVRGSARPDHVLRRWFAVLRHRFWSVVTGADIPLNCRIGGGLLMPHPNGIVIHPDAVIGPNCLLFQQVTIGSRGGPAPRLGGHVDVGAGAKLLGDIVVGAHARIGANAVVLDDVPPGDTAVGIPARSLSRPAQIELPADDELLETALRPFIAEAIRAAKATAVDNDPLVATELRATS